MRICAYVGGDLRICAYAHTSVPAAADDDVVLKEISVYVSVELGHIKVGLYVSGMFPRNGREACKLLPSYIST